MFFTFIGDATCSDDPLLYFPFGNNFNDIQCHKVPGTPNGDAELVEDGGYVRLDGDGDYVSVSLFIYIFLSNFIISI